ncbi:MAG TPA: GFA family protein [Candidatus Eisenbacteria bacterium]|nr:GFA family protein [Candidatus Eisenbacteria bacterium]
MDPLDGGCCCGSVRYRIRSVFDAGYCHCTICRRFGAPVAAWIAVPEPDFQLVRGTPRAFRSSSFFARHFCADCGTHVFGTDAREPQPKVGARLVSVALTTLDEPGRVRPAIHQWWANRLQWLDVWDELPHVDDGTLPHPSARG